MNNESPLSHILFVSVPENWNQTIGTFQIDPSILLPIETESGDAGQELKDLSWEAIISAMLKILAYDPEHSDTQYFRQFIKAVKPEITDELSQAGIIKARNGDYAVSEEIFLAICGLEPENSIPRMNLALVCEERSQAFAAVGKLDLSREYTDAALEHYHHLFTMEQPPLIAHLNAGFFYARQYDFERALHHLHVYITESDDEALLDKATKMAQSIETQNLQDSRFKQAFDFISTGEEEKGIASIEDFLRSSPDVWNAWFLLGWGLRRLHRYEEAAEAFTRATSLNDDQADSFNELAICLMELERLPEAKTALEKALLLDPENTKIISNMGILALKSGKPEQARGFFETVLDYDPADPIAIEYLEHLNQQ